ncbi:MAG: hypothetical protein PHT02_06960 [Tissierellia bacterium]|nr:hypothetical protein [Tissierellia bacterium]
MTLNAFKNGVTILNEDNLNAPWEMQNSILIYEGSAVDTKTGIGTTENNTNEYYHAIRITATGVTTITRIELEIAADGNGADLEVEIMDNDFNPDGSDDGIWLDGVVVPKEFLPVTAAIWYVPLYIEGLTSGNNYWLIIKRSGDSTNHFHLIGESSQDASHPVYKRIGTTGAWTASNAIHFTIYNGENADDNLIHSIIGDNLYKTYKWDGDDLDEVYQYEPPSDGSAGGIRKKKTITYSGDNVIKGVVT